MNDPLNSYDPGAAQFLDAVRQRKYAESSQDNEFSAIDNIGATPNSASMSDLSRQELKAELAASEAKVDARLANFDTSVKTGFAELRTDFAKMQSEMHKNTTDLIKWGIVTALGFATATIAILTFVINNAVPKAPAAAVSHPAPIVITVPSPAPLQPSPAG